MSPSFQHYAIRGNIRPMRIESLELSGIGPFVNASVIFPKSSGAGDVVLLEGPNGCGKTTILYAIASLIAGAHDVGASSSLLAPRVVDNTSLRMTISHMTDEQPLSLVLDRERLRVDFERPTPQASAARLLDGYRGMSNPVEWAAFLYQSHGPDSTVIARGAVPDLDRSLHPHHAALALNPNAHRGKDICNLLLITKNRQYRMLGRARETPSQAAHYEAIAAAMARAVDQTEVALSTVLDRNVKCAFFGEPDIEGVAIRIDGRTTEPNVLGDGMRSALSWMSDLVYRLLRTTWSNTMLSPFEQEFWLLLDEIEASLHPSRQMQIIPALRSLFPNAHIYAATHSPFVVASAGEGTVIPIRPDMEHVVRGKIVPRPLERGQSLEWVVRHVFDIQSKFMDPSTRRDLEQHEVAVDSLARGGELADWSGFLERRSRLIATNAHVGTIVLMRELPVRDVIDAKASGASDGEEGSQ